LFEEQVERTPDNIAVIFDPDSDRDRVELTYRELNERANRVGHYLRATYDIQPDDVVALQLERSEWMVAAILGVLKSGAAYLPIDPQSPPSRAAYMLEDSRAKALLVDAATFESAEEFRSALPVVKVEEVGCEQVHNPGRIATAQNLAYVIYTSGSTGWPKGVMIQHSGIVNRLNWMQHAYPIGPGDCILQKTPYTFDVSVWELIWWSMQGAKLALLGPGEEKDPSRILDAISRYGVTTMHFVPSMLGAFLAYLEQHPAGRQSQSLRQVFASGEALSASQVNRFFQLIGNENTALHNLYGPTEASIDVSYYDCRLLGAGSVVPIGKPIENIALYILDGQEKLSPVGIAGELCISGIGLARGYLNNPELTADKFIPHPFREGERLYRTGDLARWLPDGNIEFLGRIDHQLKIRGYRIEAGEVEQALLEHPAIKSAVVEGREFRQGKELVAYLVAGEGG
ncbi:MAG: amino acid adenylation domain-containing protein, partial [Phaeodactylibacter sp.]|nr:amino acid adenylation domain-containing protein [Phaeodactylibacter sp.]